MKMCPKCSYVRQPGDDAPDYECPSCGVVYAKFEAAQRKVQRDLQEPAPPAAKPERLSTARVAKCEDCGGLVSRLAVSCVHCGRPFTGDEDEHGAPVSVVDVRMKFWSMVFFMVKWSIAVIPAVLILMLVVTVFGGIFAGMMFSPR